MKCFRSFVCVLCLLSLVCVNAQGIELKNQQLGRAINFGNVLEAPSEGLWGFVLKAQYFSEIKQAGFDSIRLPISWTHHAANEAPYDIQKTFFERIDWAVQQAQLNDLNIIINIHHYDELNANPEAEAERYLSLWEQIAEHYRDASNKVYFELLNEPHERFDTRPDLWNDLVARAIQVVLQTGLALCCPQVYHGQVNPKHSQGKTGHGTQI